MAALAAGITFLTDMPFFNAVCLLLRRQASAGAAKACEGDELGQAGSTEEKPGQVREAAGQEREAGQASFCEEARYRH